LKFQIGNQGVKIREYNFGEREYRNRERVKLVTMGTTSLPGMLVASDGGGAGEICIARLLAAHLGREE
jgi:hypothetical protein